LMISGRVPKRVSTVCGRVRGAARLARAEWYESDFLDCLSFVVPIAGASKAAHHCCSSASLFAPNEGPMRLGRRGNPHPPWEAGSPPSDRLLRTPRSRTTIKCKTGANAAGRTPTEADGSWRRCSSSDHHRHEE